MILMLCIQIYLLSLTSYFLLFNIYFAHLCLSCLSCLFFKGISAKKKTTDYSERSLESDAKRHRQEIFEHYPPEAPSVRATLSNFARLQGNFKKDYPILNCGRPLWTSSLMPITLLHPIFRSFLQKLETYEPTSVDNAFVLDLSNLILKWYEYERYHTAMFHDTLNKHYNTQLFAAHICDTGYITDGHALANNYPYLITECKKATVVQICISKGGALLL